MDQQVTLYSARRSIGSILVETGRLKPEDADKILFVQRQQGLRFGDAAIKLGLLKSTDIQFALSSQFDYPYLVPGVSDVSQEVIAAYNPFLAQVEMLRDVRSQLIFRWLDTNRARGALAVVSPGRGEGRSFFAANLGVVFSQLGERTLIIDADMRNPTQHKLFGIDDSVGLSGVLSGHIPIDEALQTIKGLPNLCVLPTGPTPPNPQELLSRPQFLHMLAELSDRFDVVLIDTTASEGAADALTVASRAGNAVVLASLDHTRSSDLTSITSEMIQSGVNVVGSVMLEKPAIPKNGKAVA